MSSPLLRVEGLKTYFHTHRGVVRAVDGVSFDIERGRTLGLVGESGSGKSVTSLTLMRLLPQVGAEIAGGHAAFLGRNLLSLSRREMTAIRGCDIAMIFQEPMSCLNPVYRVGEQVAEAIRTHQRCGRAEAWDKTLTLLDEVGIPDPPVRARSYPHQLSGGQKQRVMIAMALSCDPKLLIADEPTTALDVTIQAQILDLLRQLRDRRDMAMLFITHDLGVIAQIADDVAVMYRGRLVEYGPVHDVFRNAAHPYTRGLLACRPRLDTPYKLLPTIQDFLDASADGLHARDLDEERRQVLLRGFDRPEPDETVLEVRDLAVHFPISRGLWAQPDVVRAVDGIDFDVKRGTTLGLVGESGCGKTTTGRAILRLVEPTRGTVTFDGLELTELRPAAMLPVRRRLQMIFQDPFASLNPRLTVLQAVGEPLHVHGLCANKGEIRDRVAELLREVGLLPDHMHRYPHEFSGGQRQRICIARTLSVSPEFIVCDESVSALDVSIQAQVLNLLKELQAKRHLTYLFISHDLAVVQFMSDTIAVMRDGKIVEYGCAESICQDPQQPYTQRLIAAVPHDDLQTIATREHPDT